MAAFAIGGDWRLDCVMFFVFGFSFLMIHNPLQALATELSVSARGSAVALFALCFFLGQAVGPPLFGIVSGYLGIVPMIVAEGVAIGSIGLLAARFVFARKAKSPAT